MQTAQPALSAAPDRLRVASWLNHRPLWGYGILAYGISWILLLGAVAAIQFDFFSSDSPVLGLINQIAVFGPALAAWVVIAITQGRAGVGPWLRSLVQWRVGIQWYLFVLFGIPLIMLIGESVIHGMRPFQALAQQWPMLFTRYLPYVVLTTLATGLAWLCPAQIPGEAWSASRDIHIGSCLEFLAFAQSALSARRFVHLWAVVRCYDGQQLCVGLGLQQDKRQSSARDVASCGAECHERAGG